MAQLSFNLPSSTLQQHNPCFPAASVALYMYACSVVRRDGASAVVGSVCDALYCRVGSASPLSTAARSRSCAQPDSDCRAIVPPDRARAFISPDTSTAVTLTTALRHPARLVRCSSLSGYVCLRLQQSDPCRGCRSGLCETGQLVPRRGAKSRKACIPNLPARTAHPEPPRTDISAPASSCRRRTSGGGARAGRHSQQQSAAASTTAVPCLAAWGSSGRSGWAGAATVTGVRTRDVPPAAASLFSEPP